MWSGITAGGIVASGDQFSFGVGMDRSVTYIDQGQVPGTGPGTGHTGQH